MSLMINWLRFLKDSLKVTPQISFLNILIIIIIGLSPIAEFWALQGLIESIINISSIHLLYDAFKWTIILVLITMAVDGAKVIQPYLIEYIRQDAQISMEKKLLSKAANSPLLELEHPEYFDKLQRARFGLQTNVLKVISDSARMFKNLIFIASTLFVLARYSLLAMLILLAGIIPSWYMKKQVSVNLVKLWRTQTEEQRKAKYYFDLLLKRNSIKEIRLFELEEEMISRFSKHSFGTLNERLNVVKRAGRFDCFAGITGAITYSGAVTLLAVNAYKGLMTISAFTAAIKIALSFQNSVSELIWSTSHLYKSVAFTEYLYEFLDKPRSIVSTKAEMQNSYYSKAFSVTVSNVSFRYPNSKKLTLDNISLKVKPGELIAIVGENGAGKSTLVKILMGLFPPTTGSILVNNANPYGDDAIELRSKIVAIFQDYVKYLLSIRENIGLGDIKKIANESLIVDSAKHAKADSFIAKLEGKYDTKLGKQWSGGVELSGGQWQRLAIARAYMRDSSLIFLDEPTAALDPLAEQEVFYSFKNLANKKTGFLISHRLGITKLADRIVVMKQGKVVEVGSHKELMSNNGEYRSLFSMQASWYK